MKHMDHLAGCLSSEGGTLERHHQDEDFGGQGWVLQRGGYEDGVGIPPEDWLKQTLFSHDVRNTLRSQSCIKYKFPCN